VVLGKGRHDLRVASWVEMKLQSVHERERDETTRTNEGRGDAQGLDEIAYELSPN
jgi:hypothetical protein